MRQVILLILVFFGVATAALATHNRAGEISYTKVNPDDPNDFQYEITIVTCTKASSPADRPYLNIIFGDEPDGAPVDSIERVLAIPEIGATPPDDARLNFYTTIHTYPGAGTYIISMEDPNRNGGVLNMNESISQIFYIESMLVISPFGGHNNSVKLLYPAKDEACVNSAWEHNPGAYDIDGDSLAYTLVACRGFQGQIIESWELPNLIEESSNEPDLFSINPFTGTITWDSPVLAGEYNIAIKIDEYRNGFLVGYVIRDMQVTVINCQNDPPVVAIIQDTCVIAGETLVLQVSATDNNSFVTLDAVGAPLTEVENTATFNDFVGNPATGNFNWTPQCEEIRPASYQVLFVGEDNSSTSIDLIDIMEVNISVIAPPVENLTVEPNGLSFDLSWNDHICDETISYKIYKRSGFFGYDPAHCETGVPEYTGYNFLASVNADQTTYNDTENVDFGLTYCYMIVACLANGSESIASDEICSSIIDLSIPVISKVSVGMTDLVTGQDTIQWIPPVSEDTVLLVSPYKFKLYHGEGFNQASDLIFESGSSPFIASLPREFIHNDINTDGTPNNYRIELEDADGTLVSSNTSSSLYLTIEPDDNSLLLSWESITTWRNTTFDIFKAETGGSFSFLASTTDEFYLDDGLTNNLDYCYYVVARGTFDSSLEILPEPTINFSQELCAFPVDLTPPCAPELTGAGDCETGTVSLSWNNPNESCADDVTGYRIYFKPFTDSEYELLETISSAEETSFEYVNESNITGCFYVSAIDSLLPGLGGVPNQNESVPSLEICSESCPEYELPNIFSPQGDGFNDIFEPFPYSYIDSIALTIYNRWGSIVFETNDPKINWKGENIDNGKISSDGVYFYDIRIYSSKLTGIIEEKRTGNITLLDGRKQPSD